MAPARSRLLRRSLSLVALAVVLSMLLPSALAGNTKEPPPERDSRLFRVDYTQQKLLGPAKHVAGYLGLRLASVTLDQPQYWPDEIVHLKLIFPGRAGGKVAVKWNKRDATPTTAPAVTLDEHGVAVVDLLDGTKGKRLELGEYRVTAELEASGAAPKLAGDATFSVIEGALGAVSFAFEFKKVTKVEDLDSAKAGWFLGNASGAGQRWGNGLSFKNELRVDNQPFTGDVEIRSRCMLPGCNGVDAGPRKKVRIEGGRLAGTMEVGGHSGPFQIEVITGKGSMRHQFEGSSHVERDMTQCAHGMGHVHKVGLAPYEGTTEVPGRQLFVETGKALNANDAFNLKSAIAKDGKVSVEVRRAVRGASLMVYSPNENGTFTPKLIKQGANLAAGELITVDVPEPFGVLAVGGFEGKKLVEGFAMVFPPASLEISIQAPAVAAPTSRVSVTLSVVDTKGAPVKTSGILEVFDNRVAARSAASPLTSAIGDSVRNASRALTSWVDPIELEKRRAEQAADEMQLREKAKNEVYKKDADGRGSKGLMAKPVMAPMKVMVATGGSMGRGPGSPPVGGQAGAPDPEADEGETIREGERKVVYVAVVRTDANGKATVEVPMPPQTGRVRYRFVAVAGLDWAFGEAQSDVARKAYAEAKLPRTFVPGAKLDLEIVAHNATDRKVTLTVSGAGLASVTKKELGAGRHELRLPWVGGDSGKVTLLMAAQDGKILDQREVAVQSMTSLPATFTRLAFGGKTPISLAAGETAVVFDGPGALLRGVVNNIVTTTYSWFPHAESLSAGAAVRASLLLAIDKGILSSEGFDQTLVVDLDKALRDLADRFVDPASGLIRPFPGMDPKPLWSAWVWRNLHATLRSLKQITHAGVPKTAAPLLAETNKRAQAMLTLLDKAFQAKKLDPRELGGFTDTGDGGLETIPVEIDGKVVYRVITDDAVQTFLADRLLPLLDPNQKDLELAAGKALDTFRFLRAFERVGLLQYLTDAAKALYKAGPKRRAEFDALFQRIARGMIFAQEPGLLQGPALLGGVYSQPMALVRFLELMVLVADGQKGHGTVTVSQGSTVRALKFGERVTAKGSAMLTAPSGAVVRIDHSANVNLSDGPKPAFAQATIDKTDLAVGRGATLTVTLDEGKDPLEYYAIIAVPTTTAVKQTEDILADYKGELIYGQQGQGASKMQLLAVPFRGNRTMRLFLEGLYPGTAAGFVAIRHLENEREACSVKLPQVQVR